MSEPQIRDAMPAERRAIIALTVRAYEEYAALIPDHWPHYRDGIVATLSRPAPGQQIVAEGEGALLGSVLFYPQGAVVEGSDGQPTALSEPKLRLLAVSPAARGQGVGGALLRECIRRASAAGSATLTLHTTEIMQTAQAMYTRMGFVRAPELDFEVEDSPYIIEGYRLVLEAGG